MYKLVFYHYVIL